MMASNQSDVKFSSAFFGYVPSEQGRAQPISSMFLLLDCSSKIIETAMELETI